MEASIQYLEGVSHAVLLTADELLQLNLPHKRTELIRGRLIVREPAGALHGAVTMRIGARIAMHVEKNRLGRVYAAETGFKIESGPDTVRAPDVAFVSSRRLPESDPRGYPQWAPDLAVEVLAHDDRPGDTLEKVSQWLKAGVQVVWLIDCERRTGRIYRADGTESLLGPEGQLEGESVLPGFACALAELF
jgi:Uma2 family endonuclease